MEQSRHRNLPVSSLLFNDGQIEGLPKNPRFIRDSQFLALKKSIEDAPELLDARTLLVYPFENEKFVVLAGNMRLRACLELGYNELPCYVFPKETPVEKLREYLIKDNLPFGQWDWDILANEWDAGELGAWGMETSFLSSDSWDNLANVEEEQPDPVLDKPIKIEVSIPFEQKEIEDEVRKAIEEALASYDTLSIK